MRHYNGPSTWEGGHRWVSSKDGFEWEFHDKIPLGGVRPGQRFMNGVPAVPHNPMKAMLEQPMPQQKILVTERVYNDWVKGFSK